MIFESKVGRKSIFNMNKKRPHTWKDWSREKASSDSFLEFHSFSDSLKTDWVLSATDS